MVRLGVAMDAVACLSVNDPYVVGCWGQAHGADGKIVMLADPKGEFVEQAGLGLDLTESLGDVRSKRFAMIVEDNVVKELILEDPKVRVCPSLAALTAEKLEILNAERWGMSGVGDA